MRCCLNIQADLNGSTGVYIVLITVIAIAILVLFAFATLCLLPLKIREITPKALLPGE